MKNDSAIPSVKNDNATIDLMVHPGRWIVDSRYRNRMLATAKPPGAWRLVCRDPEGGIQVVAYVTFLENGSARTVRARLRDVKR